MSPAGGPGPSALLRALLFPGAIGLLVLVLGLTGVTSSSVGVYATDNGASEEDAGILAGPDRPIRWDEWAVRTPWVFRQLERDIPERAPGALGSHDMALLYDLPTPGWEVVLRPQTAGYRLLSPERAFAIEWWSLFAIQLLGVYALLLALTGRSAVSALAASLLTLSPATQWWTTPATFTTIGYGSLATALLLFAYRARTVRGRIGLSVPGGLASAAFLATLYPPWQLGAALVLVPVGVASILPDLWRAQSRHRALRSLAVVLPVALLLAGVLFGSFMVSHRDAVEAISDTVYPGRRTANGGGGTDVRRIVSSAFDYFSSQKRYALVNGMNQSENASALPLLLPVSVGCLLLAAGRRLKGSRCAPALVGVLVGGGVIAAWMLVRVPPDVGRLLFLTKVPPPRLLLPLGFAGVIALALLVCHQSESANRLSRWQLLPPVAAFAGALAWGAANYDVDGHRVDISVAAAFVAVAVVGLALSLGRRPIVGLGVLALFTLWQASLINPIQHGTDALTKSPLRLAVDSLKRDAPPGAGWIAFQADATVKGTITAAGVDNLSGVSPYPDRASWRLLDPASANEEMWNRYAHVSFIAGTAGIQPSFELRAGDDLAVTVDPCSPVLRELGAWFVVTQGFEMGSCMRPLLKLPHGESYVMVYRYQGGT